MLAKPFLLSKSSMFVKKMSAISTFSTLLSHWIGGEEVTSSNTIDNINPATGELISKISRGGEVEVNRCVEKALDSLKPNSDWTQNFSILQRTKLLNRISQLITERIDEFAYAESIDTGKPLSLAKNLDINRSAENFRFFASALENRSSSLFINDTPSLGYHMATSSPVGVCGLISPWNLPLYLLTWKIAPALGLSKNQIIFYISLC